MQKRGVLPLCASLLPLSNTSPPSSGTAQGLIQEYFQGSSYLAL